MGIQAAPEVKYALIREAFFRDDNLLKITKLCEIAGVSRSGYYNWCAAEPRRKERDVADKSDFDLVLEAYRFRGYAKGARGIHMRLLHMGIIMNVKKIRRLMKKYRLKCPIRSANPYRRMAKAMQTSTIAPNLVNREFTGHGPRKILLTDITYLFFKNGKCYLSTILDACTHEILAYCVSICLKVDFVLNTVDELIAKHGSSLDNETIVHSDQGCHYTSMAFIQKLKEAEFVQSMSRRGNCWDNAPQESFFGHMKDHLKGKIALCTDFKAVQAQVDDFIDYYDDMILTATCFISNPAQIPAIAAWLKGSGTVTFANRAGGYYKARIANQIPFEKVLRGNPHCAFAVNFRCYPFFYDDADDDITITTSGTIITNPGSVYSEPKITVTGSGNITLMVGTTIVELTDISGSIVIDSALQEAYIGNTLINDHMSGDFPVLKPGPNAISWTGTVTRVIVKPNWRYL